MKKIFWIAASVAGLFAAASCQKESAKTGEAVVTLSVEVPASLETKAIAKAENADIVYYEVWNADWSKQLFPVDNAALASEKVENKTATVELTLVADQTYNFIFWAQNEACGAYDVNELKKVKVNYDVISANGNKDVYDAYYAVKALTVTGPINETIKLYRPFAQLNFGASKMESSFGNIELGATSVTVNSLATVFNTIAGVGETPAAAPVTFVAEGLASTAEKLVTNNSEYTWVTMDYMLMMDEKTTVDIIADFVVKEIGTVNHSISSVPLQRNYRTNIVGDLFTTDAKLQIVIDPAFEEPDYVIGIGTPVAADESLQAAINKASAGEVLVLADGTYEGVFMLDKDITIKALNPGMAVISGKVGVPSDVNANFSGIDFKVSANTLASTSHQYVNRAGNYIISIYNGKVTVDACTFSGMSVVEGTGAINQYAANNVALTVTNSTFTGDRAIRAQGSVTVDGCTFDGLDRQCLQVLGNPSYPDNQTVVFTDNKALNPGTGICGVSLATGNQIMKDMTFNVGGNDAVINNIADDGKNPAKLFADTFTYTGEVTQIIPEP